jgi:hypothetical protein
LFQEVSVRKPVELDVTRTDLRNNFRLWDIDQSEFEILWEEGRPGERKPGV